MKKELVNKIIKLQEEGHVFAGFHEDMNDRQVLTWDKENPICQEIGEDDYIGNLYLENDEGNLIVVWTYKNGWNI